MIEENVKILAVENGCLWVEGIQRSSCNSCSAQKGCGQNLLAKWAASRPVSLRIPLYDRDATSFEVGENVTIGIAEHVMVRGSLLVYLLPVVFLFLGLWVGDGIFNNEPAAMICGFTGLISGGFLAGKLADDAVLGSQLQAQLLDR